MPVEVVAQRQNAFQLVWNFAASLFGPIDVAMVVIVLVSPELWSTRGKYE